MVDRPLTLMVVEMTKFVNKTKSMEAFFAEYDGDFDGYLTPNEFYNAFSNIGSEMGILNSGI